MKNIHFLFLICFGMFLLNLLLLKLPIQLPSFFSSYLNDLLCMPVVLGICLFIIQRISHKKNLKISLFSALSLATLYSVYFEIYLPEVTERYTADFIDVLLYFVGAFIFYGFQEKSSAHLPQKE